MKESLDEKLARIDIEESMEETFFKLHGSDDPHDIRLCNYYQNNTDWINFFASPAERKAKWEAERRRVIRWHTDKTGPTLPELPVT